MKGFSQDYYPIGEKCLVLDAGAIFSGFILSSLDRCITTPSVINEVKDEQSKNSVNMVSSANKLIIIEPEKTFINKVKDEATKNNVYKKLSNTDIDVLALSIQLKEFCKEVYLVTDDYSIQKLALKLGIKIVKIKYKGIKELRK
ncbi:putative nucleic acid-binding protein with PIN domain and Zn ribbon [Caldisphaera lagunensis DSM 15908]|uniref:Putative nucleic acid-binding protein with PIN domain and Zn ribbon n=1 Tax=Caldisphaera lagunensis (strain DSM 15908 / JCM 11604 / ANMR 0165 / IC-154) TaxID=1056495 RepID=L0AB75_CALLD|nr:nucleic acid-binding protein [Caldisphaera lagunensis]AFZ71111.1 putative nucleic acid-binding protein with PIN domain and Zn ribbon [Caldisphaera lagunensis DSM 15908]